MDIAMTIGLILTGLGTFGSLFGWSYMSLRKQIGKLTMEMANRPSREELRTIVLDHLAPHTVEYNALSHRLMELREHSNELDKKLDMVLELCVKLEHGRNKNND